MNLHGYLADQYVLYDLKHRSRKDYLSEFDWYRSRRINGDYSFVLNNKLVCADMLKQYVDVPQTLASKHGENIIFNNGQVASRATLLQLFRREGKVIMKPVGYGKGKGVHLICFQDGWYFLDNEHITENKLVAFLANSKHWFLSKYVHQAKYLDDIYPHTANTIRLITLRDTNTKHFKVFFAVQRIGTAKTIPVDNGSRGGLVAKIDLTTGKLSEARSLHDLAVHQVHPDSGSPIEGVQIPRWQELQRRMVAVSGKFPYLSFIAWDILVTDEGFSVIEANTSSGVNIIQLWGGQKNGELGDFYRAHGIIR